MNRHETVGPTETPTPMGSYHERTCTRAYYRFVQACEDGRWLDATVAATEALTLHEVGYGGQLPTGALTHLTGTYDTLCRDGSEVTPV